MIYNISNEYYSLSVSSTGAEMISMKNASGRELFWHGEGELWPRRAPILFPLCGTFKNNRYSYGGKSYEMQLHGFALKSEFKLVYCKDREIAFELSESADTLLEYPFPFKLSVRYELCADKLVFTASVTNTGGEPMPYMFGWHPAFILPTEDGEDIEDYVLDFGELDSLVWHLTADNPDYQLHETLPYPLTEHRYKLCEKEIYENDTMIFTGHKNETKLFAPGHPYELSFSWSENLPTLCIWKEPFNSEKFICVEPWCEYRRAIGDNAKFDNMKKLSPGECDNYRCEFSIKTKG